MIAVIPIFVNAGTAVLPTVAAALASIVMVLLKPRELLQFVRRRPLAAGVLAGALVLGLGIACWCLTSTTPNRVGKRERTAAVARYDWAKVAQDLIAQQRVRQEAAVTARTLTTDAYPQAPVAAATGVADLGSPTQGLVLEGAFLPATRGQDGVPGAEGYTQSRIGEPHALDTKTDAPVSVFAAQENSSHDLSAEEAAPIGLIPLWSFRPEDTMFLGAPAVVGNRVFAAGCQTDLGGYTGLLACLDRETGKPLWQVTEIKSEPLRPFFSSPAVTADGRYLVIGQGLHEDRDCALLCFDAATGQLRWAVRTPLHIESSPAIFGDVAVVGAGAVEGKDGRPIGDPGYCLAVRISDGKELWRQPVNDPESSPAVDEAGIVYIGSGFNGSAVVAVRRESEEQLRAKGLDRIAWRTAVAQPIPGPITLAGGVVIAGGGNSDLVHSNRNARGLVVALDRSAGAILWQTEFDDAVLGRIACRDEVLVCPVRTGEVVALTLKEGHVLWRSHISGNTPVLGGCIIAGTRVYAASSDGYLAILAVKDGRVLEKIYLNDQAKPGNGLTLSTPCITGGRVVVGSETGGLRCLVGSGGAP